MTLTRVAAGPINAAPLGTMELMSNTPLCIGVALAASACFATAVVFQQEAAVEAQAGMNVQPAAATNSAPVHHSVVALALAVLRRRAWLLATTVDFAGFLLQSVALHLGRITLVQPILVTVLALGMVIGAWRSHTSLGLIDLFGLLFLSGGIVGFLLAAQPSRGGAYTLPGRLPFLVVSVLGLLGVAVAISSRFGPRGRATVLAFAAGTSFAVVAALAKEVGDELSRSGVAGVLGHYPAYALAVVAISGLSVEQTAFAAGPLVPTLVTLTLVDPLASLLTGVFVYGEDLRGGLAAGSAAVLCGLLAAVGVVLVARSRATARVQSPAAILSHAGG